MSREMSQREDASHAPNQRYIAHFVNKQKNKCSRHQKHTRSTHTCLGSLPFPPPLYTHTHTRTYAYTHARTHVHTLARTHVLTHAYVCVRACVYARARTHTYTRTHTHTHAHISQIYSKQAKRQLGSFGIGDREQVSLELRVEGRQSLSMSHSGRQIVPDGRINERKCARSSVAWEAWICT